MEFLKQGGMMIAMELLQIPAGHPNAQPVGPRGKARQTADLASGGAVGVDRHVRQDFAGSLPPFRKAVARVGTLPAGARAATSSSR